MSFPRKKNFIESYGEKFCGLHILRQEECNSVEKYIQPVCTGDSRFR